MSIQLFHGDCLEIMPMLDAGSIDAILTDLPYGTTACSWDTVIPFEPMWAAVKRVLKPRGVFVTTASQPFTSALVMSNPEWLREELIWEKQHPKGFLDARRKHMDAHESIIVFADGLPTYNPQGLMPVRVNSGRKNKGGNGVYGKVRQGEYIQTEGNFPRSILRFDAITNGHVHPTQKPVALYEYLVLTYTNPGDTVLDCCAGSGTTGVACAKTGRNFIGIEKRADYFEIMNRRIKEAQQQPMLDGMGG